MRQSIVCFCFLLAVSANSIPAGEAEAGFSDSRLQLIRDGFDERVKQAFVAERGKPLVRARKRPPLKPGRGNYVRHYSWSIIDFATRCFLLNEQTGEANAALIENARHYLDHPKDINDQDSFHWHAEMLCRLIELYGARGSSAPGRLTPEAEKLMMETLWLYASKCIRPDELNLQDSQTWYIHGSDNHHTMDFIAKWHFAKLARVNPEFRDRKYPGGATAAGQYAAWTQYIKEYCAQRAKKGLFTEIASDGYNVVGTKGFYNVFDFADDPVLKRRAGCLLDLHWAMWAQEQLDGVRGGGKSRIYQNGGDRLGDTEMRTLAWFYFGIGGPSRPLSPLLPALTSSWRPPLVVIDLALDITGRGRYSILHRPMGLAIKGYEFPKDLGYRLDPAGGGIVCSSWCTPAFILGTPMVEPRPAEDWVAISSQNRWHGAIFAGALDARIVPQVKARDERVAFNAQWSVQRKGTMICQKLKTHKYGNEMRVWFSKAGLTNRCDEAGWIFVEAPQAYAAVRVVAGGAQWDTGPIKPPLLGIKGSWLRCQDEWTPVILEVACKEDFADYAAFRKAVAALPCTFDQKLLSYQGLSGDTFTFDANQKNLPAIDGRTVDFAPPKVLDSPFVQADWNGGIVTIAKSGRKLILNFND